jgi:hypothetical protein
MVSKNFRDLGGTPLIGGGTIAPGALMRSDNAERIDAAGWAALQRRGVRTVVDLRNDDERGPDAAPRPATIETVVCPHDGLDEQPEFWAVWKDDPRFASPRFFGPHLDALPHRSARALRAIAHARPGGVLVHCQGGRDRTGLITALALTVAGAEPEAIADDYARSFTGPGAQNTDAAMLVALGDTTPRAALLDVLRTDLLGALARGGFTEDDARALRARLRG